MARNATRFGMSCYLSQYTCERSIGILGALVRQPSNPYTNLSNEAIILAWLHALYARAPDLDPSTSTNTLPYTAIKLDKGYADLDFGAFLTRRECFCRTSRSWHDDGWSGR